MGQRGTKPNRGANQVTAAEYRTDLREGRLLVFTDGV
jgi:hypothetical protein